MRFIRRLYEFESVDVEHLKAKGWTRKIVMVGSVKSTKSIFSVLFPFEYFPVLNPLMQSICLKLNERKVVPKEWVGKTISIISILSGKYPGWDYLKKLMEGAELWVGKR